MSEKDAVLGMLVDIRNEFEAVLPKVDGTKEIFPGWTIKELLDHIAGWDEICLAALQAHLNARQPVEMEEGSIDRYNEVQVARRRGSSLEQALAEFRSLRQDLVRTIAPLTEEQILEAFPLPWKETGSPKYILEILIHHEKVHLGHLRKWLEAPGQPLDEGA